MLSTKQVGKNKKGKNKMRIKEFNSINELEKYYDEKTNTYVFDKGEDYIELVIFNFDLNIQANIDAWNIEVNDNINANDIKAYDITAYNIKAHDIKAHNIHSNAIIANDIYARNIDSINIKSRYINAVDINGGDINTGNIDAGNICAENIKAKHINYYAIFCAYKNIKCKSIKGRRKNAKHFVLDGKIEVEEK